MDKKRRALKGFSLVELVIVVAILAILTTIGLQVFSNMQASAQTAVVESNARMIANQLNYFYLLNTNAAIAPTDDVAAAYETLKANGATVGVDPVVMSEEDEQTALTRIVLDNGAYRLID